MWCDNSSVFNIHSANNNKNLRYTCSKILQLIVNGQWYMDATIQMDVLFQNEALYKNYIFLSVKSLITKKLLVFISI